MGNSAPRQTKAADESPIRTTLDGVEPVTDHESKRVMLTAQVEDQIRIKDVVREFGGEPQVPNQVTVMKRAETFHGPRLLVHSEESGEDFNYLLTCPGPNTHLYFWEAETDDRNFRKSWYLSAEVKAKMTSTGPGYEICSDCGEPLSTLEHRRASMLGQCTVLDE